MRQRWPGTSSGTLPPGSARQVTRTRAGMPEGREASNCAVNVRPPASPCARLATVSGRTKIWLSCSPASRPLSQAAPRHSAARAAKSTSQPIPPLIARRLRHTAAAPRHKARVCGRQAPAKALCVPPRDFVVLPGRPCGNGRSLGRRLGLELLVAQQLGQFGRGHERDVLQLGVLPGLVGDLAQGNEDGFARTAFLAQ